MVTGGGIPIDAPLYEVDLDSGADYWGCKAIAEIFTVDGDAAALIPEGLKLAGNPPLGMVLLADYGDSTLGPYREFVSLIQVVDESGAVGMYIPYIYVTNDAALAAGRELLGAPKKLARIELSKEYEMVQGVLERPSSKRLVTVVMKLSTRMGPGVLRAFMAEETPYYSLRYLPAPPGGTSVRELVRWTSKISVRRDRFAEELAFTGAGSLTYDSPSAIDPVHNLGVGTLLGSVYLEFDMRLGNAQVVRSEVWQEPANSESAPATNGTVAPEPVASPGGR